MAITGKNGKLAWAAALGGVAVIVAASSGVTTGVAGEGEAGQALAAPPLLAGSAPGSAAADRSVGVGGAANPAEAQQALEGLAQIRQQQCQMGNQLACQVLPSFAAVRRQLAQAAEECRSGSCDSYNQLSQRIFTSYSESAGVMRAGEQGMAQMDAWRGQMNRNAANNLATLQGLAARGQAAHEARQESNAAMSRGWQAGQDSMERSHGRFVDRIYEGTTMDRGGVQARIADGSTGYTDGYGNVIAVPDGQRAPDGWQKMSPTYAAPR